MISLNNDKNVGTITFLKRLCIMYKRLLQTLSLSDNNA